MRPDCPHPERIESYLLGEIAPPEADAVERHLSSCPHCEATIHRLESPLETVLCRLRRSAPADEYADEPDCQRAAERAAALARSPEGSPAGNTPSAPGRHGRRL